MPFTLSGPSLIEVKQGESASAVYRAARTIKPYRTVTFSVSGLPAGITASFSPISCVPTCQATLRLTASASSAVGTFTIMVTAWDSKSSKSMPVVMTNYSPNLPGPTVYVANYYVATNGLDSNPGTIGSPFLTMDKAESVAVAGDLIYVRGGTYNVSSRIWLTKSGTSGNPIRLFAYPGETPILDGINDSNLGGHARLDLTSKSWWHIKGLEIKNGPGPGILIQGSSNNIIVEFCNIHHNVRLDGNGGGINVADTSSNILILNNDVHHSSINQTSGTGGDGIAVAYTQQTGNIIRGNRVWRNHDDGIDLWDAANVLVEDNWSWENGLDDNLNPTSGNGIGFKLGGAGTGDGNHTIRRNLAWCNRIGGFDDNSADVAMVVYNNTAYSNGGNYAFYSAVANVLKNNIAFSPNTVSFNAAVQHTFNSWNEALGVTVTSADFVTLDFTANLGSRQADGSLPSSNFLRLVGGSDLIDAGVDVGLPYNGAAPDLGAYET